MLEVRCKKIEINTLQSDVVCVDSNFSSPTVIHVIPEGKPVDGVTSLGNDVYVVRRESQQKI